MVGVDIVFLVYGGFGVEADPVTEVGMPRCGCPGKFAGPEVVNAIGGGARPRLFQVLFMLSTGAGAAGCGFMVVTLFCCVGHFVRMEPIENG